MAKKNKLNLKKRIKPTVAKKAVEETVVSKPVEEVVEAVNEPIIENEKAEEIKAVVEEAVKTEAVEETMKESEEVVIEAKHRGRPKKEKAVEDEVKEPKKRGRKAKVQEEVEAKSETKRRGRPKKEEAAEEEVKEPKKRGRKAKAQEEAEAKSETKRRGRPKKEETVEEVKEPKKRVRKAKTIEEPIIKEEVIDVVYPYSVEEGMQAMAGYNVHYSFDEYHRILIENETVEKAIDHIIDECQLSIQFDRSILERLYADLIRRVDVTRKDFEGYKAALEEKMSRYCDTYEEDCQLYHDTFYFMGKLFEYGQRFNLRSSEILNEWVGVDISKYFNFYLDMAMRVLKGWQYKDVENYEEFVSEVFSQFSDLAGKFEFRFLLDLSDLQISHGYFHNADTTFEYMLRENNIKDYIYYRYAHAYVDVDLAKAKWIAGRSFSVVDERFVYYPKLVEIANM